MSTGLIYHDFSDPANETLNNAEILSDTQVKSQIIDIQDCSPG